MAARMLRRELAVVAVAMAIGCNGSALDVGDDDRGPVPISPELLATCAPAAETTHRFETETELRNALVGRWFRCRGQDTGVLYFPGLELTDRGAWYALEGEPSSGVVRSAHPARHGSYTTVGTTTLQFAFADEQRQSIVILFDDSGRRMSVVFSTSNAVDIAFVHE